MADINDNDKPGINDAFEKLMRIAGLREGVLTFRFTDLLDQGTDSNPTYGTISATALVSATAAMLPVTSSVADGGSAVAIKLGSSVALANAGAKLVSIQNDSVEKAFFDINGALSSDMVRSFSAVSLALRGAEADGATAVAVKLGSSVALSNADAKLLAMYSDAGLTEKVAFGVTGKLVWPTGGAEDVVGVSAALAAGSATVLTTAVAAGSKVFLTRAVAGGTLGHLSVGTITPGVSFTITSSDAGDTSTVNWMVVN